MPDSKRYTTISLHEDLKAGFELLKDSDETNNEVMRRALVALREKEDREKSRWEYHNARTAEQSRLLVRMADEIGLDAEQIPGHMAASEAHGKTDTLDDVFQPPDEQVSDVNRAEKLARAQAEKEVLDLERGDDGFLRPADQDHERPDGSQPAMFGISDEEEEKIQQRAAEILAASDEPNEGYTDGFDSDNGGDH